MRPLSFSLDCAAERHHGENREAGFAKSRCRPCRLAGLALALFLAAPIAHATNLEVEGPQDSLLGAPTINHCTLRKAIINSNTDTAAYPQCAAGSGVDDITFLTYFNTITFAYAGAGEDAALTGDLDITASVNITGPDSGMTIDAAALDRIFHINPG